MKGTVRRLRGELEETVRSVLPPTPDRWGLLPVPLHGNVGDSAILLATVDLLASLGWPPPTLMSDQETFDPEEIGRRIGRGPILLMGGGNFGDLYPSEHRVREQVFASLPDNPVVQLPQSVRFESEGAVRRTAEALAGREGQTILVRDAASQRWLSEHLPQMNAVLCPDIAFGIGPMVRPEPVVDVVRLLRQDQESSIASGDGGPGREVVDWLTDSPHRTIAAERRLREMGHHWAVLRPMTNRLREGLHLRIAALRLRRGVLTLGRGRVVITDRLHGHIMCVLLGIPHAVLNDRHGKISGFVKEWTEALPGVRLCYGLDEAEEAASDLLGGCCS